MIRLPGAFLGLVVCVCIPLNAQQADPNLTPTDSVQLREVVLMARIMAPKHGGLTPSESIGPERIAPFSPVDYTGALNTVPGALLQSGAFNTNRISIRGIGARSPFGTDKLRMYYNGIPVTSGTGVSVIEAFDLDNLAQIEIVKGPYGTRYGSPLGGVLLLESIDVPQEGEQFISRTSLGSFGLFKNHSRYQSLSGQTQLALSFNSLQSTGYRDNSQFDRTGLLLQGEKRIGPHARLGFLLNHISYFAQIPSTLNRDDFENNPEQAAQNWLEARGFEENQYVLGGVYHKWHLGHSMLWRTAVFYSYLDHYEARPFGILTDLTHSAGMRTELYRDGSQWDFAVGLETFNDSYRWKTYENLIDPVAGGSNEGSLQSRNREYRHVHFAFGQLYRTLSPELRVGIAMSANLSRYQFRSFEGQASSAGTIQRRFDPILLPKLEAIWESPMGEWYFRAGRGFSNPSLEEALTPEGVLNPEIRQEKGISYEMGYQLASRRMRLSLNAYQMQVTDLLVAERFDEDQFIGVNAGSSTHRGLEIQWQGYWGKPNKARWEPRLSYTFSDFAFREFVDADVDFSGNALPGVPRHYLNTGLRWAHPNGLSITWTHEYSDVVPLDDANTTLAEAYHLDRLHAAYRVELLNGWTFGLEIGANNLLDVQYARSFAINAVGFGGNAPRYFYPGEPINFWAGLSAGIRW